MKKPNQTYHCASVTFTFSEPKYRRFVKNGYRYVGRTNFESEITYTHDRRLAYPFKTYAAAKVMAEYLDSKVVRVRLRKLEAVPSSVDQAFDKFAHSNGPYPDDVTEHDCRKAFYGGWRHRGGAK